MFYSIDFEMMRVAPTAAPPLTAWNVSYE